MRWIPHQAGCQILNGKRKVKSPACLHLYMQICWAETTKPHPVSSLDNALLSQDIRNSVQFCLCQGHISGVRSIPLGWAQDDGPVFAKRNCVATPGNTFLSVTFLLSPSVLLAVLGLSLHLDLKSIVHYVQTAAKTAERELCESEKVSLSHWIKFSFGGKNKTKQK